MKEFSTAVEVAVVASEHGFLAAAVGAPIPINKSIKVMQDLRNISVGTFKLSSLACIILIPALKPFRKST